MADEASNILDVYMWERELAIDEDDYNGDPIFVADDLMELEAAAQFGEMLERQRLMKRAQTQEDKYMKRRLDELEGREDY